MRYDCYKIALIYALVAVGLWSTVATAFKLTLAYLNPQTLLFYASLSSWLLFGALVWRQGRFRAAWEIFRRYRWQIVILGAINPFLYYLSLFHAYALLPAQEAQAINYSWGVLMALLSVPILGQTLRRRDIVAGILCYFGVLIIATRGDLLSLHFYSIEGVALALFSTLLWAIYWLLNARIDADPIELLFLNFSVGLLLLSLERFIFGGSIRVVPLEGLLGALYVGLFEMGLTFIFWLKALKLSDSAASISNLIYLSPPLSLIFIHNILDESIYPSTFIALILIFGGLWLQRKGV